MKPPLLLALIVWCVSTSSRALATDEVHLQAGDVVRIVVPGLEPGDRTLDLRGIVDLGRLGLIELAGCTTPEASDRVSAVAARVLRDVTRVEVTLVRRALLVEVTGLVARPGLVTLPPGADLWVGLAAAGGVSDHADLHRVQVRRSPGTDSGASTADVRRWLAGEGPPLPSLQTGDVVFVPARSSFVAIGDDRPIWTPTTDGPSARLTPGVNVIGGVARPGRVPLVAPLPLLDVLALAGGPATDGDLRRITLVRKTAGLSSSTTIDASTRPSVGASRILVGPGDTVIVGRLDEDPLRIAVQTVANIALIAGVVGVLVGLLGQAS